MRQCASCGNTLTDAATFCPACGTEAPVAAPPPETSDKPKFCASCGAPLAPGARFCPSCGAAATGSTTPSPVAPVSVAPAVAPLPVADEPAAGPSRNLLIGAGVALLIVALLVWFNRFELLGLDRPEGKESAALGEETVMYAVANANLRDKATTQGSTITGKLLRGAKVTGVLQLGADSNSQWFKLTDGNYIPAINLSDTAPPPLARTINKPWYAPDATPLLARPQAGSAVVENAEPGKAYQLIGLTANNFAEVALGKGGVAYFDASGVDLAASSAPPIAIAFSPGNCGYGREVDMLLRKLAQDATSRQQLAAASSYPDDEARDAALAELETASAFLPLKRSFKGLAVGGLATHYEASSIYFRDTPDKVFAVFRQDYPVDADGSIPTGSEVSASIQATAGEARKYGQTELICGL